MHCRHPVPQGLHILFTKSTKKLAGQTFVQVPVEDLTYPVAHRVQLKIVPEHNKQD